MAVNDRLSTFNLMPMASSYLIGNSVPEDRETFGGFYGLFILTPDITAPDYSTLTKYPVTFEN